MRSWKREVTGLAGALLAVVVTATLAAPAGAETYSWRTEDGGYAFTDNKDKIPARYRAQAKPMSRKSLESYERYTPQDHAASARYAERLQSRLDSLRESNAAVYGDSDRDNVVPERKLTLPTGGAYAPLIDAPLASNSEPVIIEPRLMAGPGEFRTRRVTIVRQGDRTLAVIKGHQHNFNASQDILDEEDYDSQR